MVKRLLAGLGAAVAIVLASCSENGLLTPLSSQTSQVTIQSVANGTMVTSGDKIPLSVKLNSTQVSPTDLKVELLSDSGQIVQSASLTNVDFSAPLPSVLLSSLSTGPYTMRLTLDGSGNQVIAQKKINIFYVSGTYSLDGITSYPPTLSPGGSGLIVARVTAPQDSDPYFRWSMGDKLLANGYLSKGFDELQWNAPTSPGVYSITVEMFPFGPPPGGSFDFTSPYRMKVEVFVTSGVSSGRNELGPGSSYYALYHFQGNLKNAGSGTGIPEAIPVGEPTLSVNGSVFGYQLDGSSGFKVNALLLPVGQHGYLEPASITMRLRLDKLQSNRQFFSTSTSDGGFSFDIGTNGKGLLSATVDGTPEPGGVAIKSGDVTSVTLSIVPAGSALELLWFVDGQLSLYDSVPFNPQIVSTAGTSLIGGTNGFTGLIDEFGVYYLDERGRHTTDPEVYRTAMVDDYGSNLVFAEGFDGIFLPEDLTYGGAVKRSELAGGLLTLPPGQSVTLPQFTLGEEDLTVSVALSGLSSTGQGVLTLSSNGQSIYSTALKSALSANGSVQITLSRNGSGLQVTPAGGSPSAVKGDVSKLQLSVASSGTAPIELRSFLIVKTRAQLADKTAPRSSLPSKSES